GADRGRAGAVAGVPWLADWGRQTMIGAPGLPQATGRAGVLGGALNGFAAQRRDGLIPSHYSREEGEPEYESIDSSLWFVLAVDWFGRARRKAQAPSPLLGAVRSVI